MAGGSSSADSREKSRRWKLLWGAKARVEKHCWRPSWLPRTSEATRRSISPLDEETEMARQWAQQRKVENQSCKMSEWTASTEHNVPSLLVFPLHLTFTLTCNKSGKEIYKKETSYNIIDYISYAILYNTVLANIWCQVGTRLIRGITCKLHNI